MGRTRKRTIVRAERLDTACGCIGHMTVDQIKERSIGEHMDASCPQCGRIHLTIEDAEESAAKRYSESDTYQYIADQALATTSLTGKHTPLRYLVSMCIALVTYLFLCGQSFADESTIYGCLDKHSGARRIVSGPSEYGSYEMVTLMDKASGETDPEDKMVKVYSSKGEFLGLYTISEFSLEEVRLASSGMLRFAH